MERVGIPSGPGYRVAAPLEAHVVPELAHELARVFARFAAEAGRTDADPVTIEMRPGIFGHHQLGRAADIYAVGGTGMETWKWHWDAAMCRARTTRDRAERYRLHETEPIRNLGWRLYRALQIHGRWAQPYGYPIQLFGPWTRSEGPWKFISDRLLRAHRDHIHVAK